LFLSDARHHVYYVMLSWWRDNRKFNH